MEMDAIKIAIESAVEILLLNSPSNEIVIRLVLYSNNNVWKVQCVLEKVAIERTLPSGKYSYSYHPVEEFG